MSESVPSVPSEKGGVILKTPQNASISYCITWNNYKDEDILKFKEFLSSKCAKYIYQFEVGENGTKHIQGFFKLLKKERITGLKKILGNGPHFEKPRGSEDDNYNYCSKEGGEGLQVFNMSKPMVREPLRLLDPALFRGVNKRVFYVARGHAPYCW